MNTQTLFALSGGIALLSFTIAIVLCMRRAMKRVEPWWKKMLISFAVALAVPLPLAVATFAYHWDQQRRERAALDAGMKLPGAVITDRVGKDRNELLTITSDRGVAVFAVRDLSMARSLLIGIPTLGGMVVWLPVWAVFRFVSVKPEPKGFEVQGLGPRV